MDSKLDGAVQRHLREHDEISNYHISNAQRRLERENEDGKPRANINSACTCIAYMYMYLRLCHRLRREHRSNMRVQFPDYELTISSLEKKLQVLTFNFLFIFFI